jgi:hypothetical protein
MKDLLVNQKPLVYKFFRYIIVGSLFIIAPSYAQPFHSETENSPLTDNQLTATSSKSTTVPTRIRFADNVPSHKRAMLKDWVNHAENALRSVYGTLPVDDYITIIKASNRGSSAVPWGEVNRYSPPEVTLVVNTKSSLKELKADWTIYHELSHLLIPYDAGDARWFSEGLASYYQNITQARVGMFDEQTMWQKLYNGFERGNKQQKYSHQPLSYVSDNIGQNRNYMRIYWSGALYWLKADVSLRELTKNTASPYSLDLALKQLQQCCFDRYLSVEKIVEKLDELSQSQVFSTLLAEFSTSYAIPEYLPLLNSLGIEGNNGKVILNNNAKLSAQRKAIFTGNSL